MPQLVLCVIVLTSYGCKVSEGFEKYVLTTEDVGTEREIPIPDPLMDCSVELDDSFCGSEGYPFNCEDLGDSCGGVSAEEINDSWDGLESCITTWGTFQDWKTQICVDPGGGAPAATGVAEQDAPLCSIQTLFSELTAIKANPVCREGCNAGSGDCPPDWVPGADDICEHPCGAVFEPFWDSCGEL
eukprot:SAG11_NODE_8691_length_986_cov_11.490417_1_plen_185_part_01